MTLTESAVRGLIADVVDALEEGGFIYSEAVPLAEKVVGVVLDKFRRDGLVTLVGDPVQGVPFTDPKLAQAFSTGVHDAERDRP